MVVAVEWVAVWVDVNTAARRTKKWEQERMVLATDTVHQDVIKAILGWGVESAVYPKNWYADNVR